MFTLAVFHIITVYNRFFLGFQPKYLHKNKVDRVLSLSHHCQFGFLSLYSPVIDRQTDTKESTKPKKSPLGAQLDLNRYISSLKPLWPQFKQTLFCIKKNHKVYFRLIRIARSNT